MFLIDELEFSYVFLGHVGATVMNAVDKSLL